MVLHRRGWSLSSLESFGDLDDDEQLFNEGLCLSDRFLNNLVPPPPPPLEGGLETPRPLRRRLGAGESVNAVSSPEIKALDLPLTPAFPRRQKQRQNKQHQRNKSVPIGMECSANDLPDSPPKPFVVHIDNEYSDAQMPAHESSLPPTPPVKTRTANKKVLRSRSNNVVHAKENGNIIKEKSIRRDKKVQRTPSHRRLSVDSLPSPEDIAEGDISSKSLTRECCLDSISSHGRDMNRSSSLGPKCRPKLPFRERSLNVTTAFR